MFFETTLTARAIDERTAAVWSGDVWSAMGDGKVTVITTNADRTFGSGDAIEGVPSPVSTEP